MHEHNQDLSVKLTAYLMGELDAAETQEMDRALADSAESLRARSISWVSAASSSPIR